MREKVLVTLHRRKMMHRFSEDQVNSIYPSQQRAAYRPWNTCIHRALIPHVHVSVIHTAVLHAKMIHDVEPGKFRTPINAEEAQILDSEVIQTRSIR